MLDGELGHRKVLGVAAGKTDPHPAAAAAAIRQSAWLSAIPLRA